MSQEVLEVSTSFWHHRKLQQTGERRMSDTVTGYIDHVIFRNEENGYTVMVLKGTGVEEDLTCVGSFPAVPQGATSEAEAEFTHQHVE